MKKNVNGRTEAFVEKMWADKYHHHPQIFNKIYVTLQINRNWLNCPKDQISQIIIKLFTSFGINTLTQRLGLWVATYVAKKWKKKKISQPWECFVFVIVILFEVIQLGSRIGSFIGMHSTISSPYYRENGLHLQKLRMEGVGVELIKNHLTLS